MAKRKDLARIKNIIIYLWILMSVSVFAQPKTNLDVFYSLVDTTVNGIVSSLPASAKTIKLGLNLGDAYTIFTNNFISDITSNGIIISKGVNDSAVPLINIVVDNAKVTYGEMFKNGFWGSYYVTRKLILSGNYLIQDSVIKSEKFYYSFIDSVKVDDIQDIENISYPFTQGKLPAEPFFSGLFEPIIAIGAAAVAIYLFFTIRSK